MSVSFALRSMLRTIVAVPVVATAIALGAALAAKAETAAGEPPKAAYWHDWTDGKGVSHLTLCELNKFELEAMAPPADPEWTNRQDPGNATVLTVVQPTGWKGPWHKETTVLWIVTLKGTWFIEAMDGTKVDLKPGDVWFAEDRDSKPDAEGRVGHRSGNIGDDPVTLLVVQLETPPTVDQACRFK
jgi:quercetin dioxygenase-like cupin family protein